MSDSAATLRQAFVGAGANLGDRRTTLEGAIERLRSIRGIASVTPSSFYETEPVGVTTTQPEFLNLALAVETTLGPEALLGVLLEIEQAFGRVRQERWGPRTLDLDLLAYEGETRSTPELQLPHPRMFERNFVVAPLHELLALPAGQGPCWDALRARLATAQPQGKVRRIPV